MSTNQLNIQIKVDTEYGRFLPRGWRFRINFFGRLILQRQYHHYAASGDGHPEVLWRDANSKDLTTFIPQGALL